MSFQPLIEDLQAELTGIKVPDGFGSLQHAMHKIGLQTPVERGVGAAAVVAAVLYGSRPEFAFDDLGARPFALTSNSSDATLFNPAVLAVSSGVLAALFL